MASEREAAEAEADELAEATGLSSEQIAARRRDLRRCALMFYEEQKKKRTKKIKSKLFRKIRKKQRTKEEAWREALRVTDPESSASSRRRTRGSVPSWMT